MNLIEKLGLEKCKQIVDGAPETATDFSGGKYYEEWSHTGWVVSDGRQWVDCKKPNGELISIEDLRTALADHDRIDTCSDIRNHVSPNTKVIEHEWD